MPSRLLAQTTFKGRRRVPSTVRYELSLAAFEELEQRHFHDAHAFAFVYHRHEAYGIASLLAGRVRPLMDLLCVALGADGVCVDIVPSDANGKYAVETSVELVPGRSPVVWHGTECHDNGHERCDHTDDEW